MVESAGKPFRVLVVEDSPLFRAVLRARLQAMFPSAELLEALGVEEGYRIAMEKEPDVVFIDVGLPDGNGLDLLTTLRAELPCAALAVCTMHDMPEYRKASLGRGAGAFFGKQRMDWAGMESFVRGALDRGGDPEALALDLEGEPETTADSSDPAYRN